MADKVYRIELTKDAVQPITVPNGATFLSASREPDRTVDLYFLGSDTAGSMDMVISQIDDVGDVLESSVRHLGSAFGIKNSHFVTTHIFEVLS